MGTRGAFGFKINNEYKISYNHYDSYISGLGISIVKQLINIKKKNQLDELKERVKKIKLVNESIPPTKEDQIKYRKFLNSNVGGRSGSVEWYQLLRETQGDFLLDAILKDNLEHMLDSKDFLYDSLFCEYAYIINFDDNTFNVYVGFQKEPFDENEFGTKSNENYYPVKLVYKEDLSKISLAKMKKLEELLSLEE